MKLPNKAEGGKITRFSLSCKGVDEVSNISKIEELQSQIRIWSREIENNENMIEETYHRIDQLREEDEAKEMEYIKLAKETGTLV